MKSYMYIYIYIHISLFIHAHVSVSVCVSIYIYTYMYICITPICQPTPSLQLPSVAGKRRRFCAARSTPHLQRLGEVLRLTTSSGRGYGHFSFQRVQVSNILGFCSPKPGKAWLLKFFEPESSNIWYLDPLGLLRDLHAPY